MSFLSQPITLQSLFGKKRTIGPVTVQVVLNESTSDTLTITKQPVQQGASITDHSFMEPCSFSCQLRFADNLTESLSDIYEELQELQRSRVPFDIVTPKRLYSNMLIGTLGNTTDKQTENILAISLSCQEIIIVKVSTTTVPRSKQKNPGSTQKTQKAGKKSALRTIADGVLGVVKR